MGSQRRVNESMFGAAEKGNKTPGPGAQEGATGTRTQAGGGAPPSGPARPPEGAGWRAHGRREGVRELDSSLMWPNEKHRGCSCRAAVAVDQPFRRPTGATPVDIRAPSGEDCTDEGTDQGMWHVAAITVSRT
jgi:hypothetical protein